MPMRSIEPIGMDARCGRERVFMDACGCGPTKLTFRTLKCGLHVSFVYQNYHSSFVCFPPPFLAHGSHKNSCWVMVFHPVAKITKGDKPMQACSVKKARYRIPLMGVTG